MIKVKVIKASRRSYWYANYLGQEFDVEKCLTYYQQVGDIVRRYELRFEGETLRHFIHEDDTIILK